MVTAKGNRIVLDDEDSLSYIENKATGTKFPLKIESWLYVREAVVELAASSAFSPNEAPLRRPAK